MFKRHLLVAATLGLFTLSGAATADNTLSGVLESVDFKNYTLSLINSQTGAREQVSFNPKTRTLVNGRPVNAREYLLEGQEVVVKFKAAQDKQASL